MEVEQGAPGPAAAEPSGGGAAAQAAAAAPPPLDSVLDGLAQLWREGALCDVELATPDGELHRAHR